MHSMQNLSGTELNICNKFLDAKLFLEPQNTYLYVKLLTLNTDYDL